MAALRRPEFSTRLTEALGAEVEVTLIDRAEAFVFVYAVGDVTSVGTAKAGVFAEGAARVVADQLIARIRGADVPAGYDGTGSCYIEFGRHEVARVDVDFFSMPGHPIGAFTPPTALIAAEKVLFASSRRARWFG